MPVSDDKRSSYRTSVLYDLDDDSELQTSPSNVTYTEGQMCLYSAPRGPYETQVSASKVQKEPLWRFLQPLSGFSELAKSRR